VVPNGSYRFGSSGHNILDDPGNMGISLSPFKNVPVRERGQMQFRWKACDAFHHANFSLPNTSGNALNGAATSRPPTAPTLRFGLRYQFQCESYL